MQQYRKAVVAVIAAAVIVLNEFFGAAIGLSEVEEIINVGTALGGAVGVFQIPNSRA